MAETVLRLAAGPRRLSLALVIAHMLAIGLVIGISFPLTALVLESWGVETWLIGLVGAMPALAIVVTMPWLPAAAQRFGTLPSMLAGCTLGALALLALPLFPNVAAWIFLRFVIGLAMGLPWLVGETWINAVALEASRGRVMALYAASLFAGFAGGPLLLEATGTQGWLPFLVAAGGLALAMLPLLAARRLAPPMSPAPDLRLARVVRRAPLVAQAAFLAGTVETALFALLPLYGLGVGLAEPQALRLLTLLLLGGILLQYPLGWLADRLPRAAVLLVISLAAAGLLLLLPLLVERFLLLGGAVFLLGGLALAFYSIGLALLGQRFPAGELAVANAAFILLYELGGVIGPALAGAALDLWPPTGFLAALAALCLAFALLALAVLDRPKRGARWQSEGGEG